MIGAEAHVRISREMNYEFRTFHRTRQAAPVEQICLMQSEFRVTCGTLQEPPLSGRQIIESDDRVARGQKAIHHVAANKSSRTRNQNLQSNLRLKKV